MAAAPRRAVRAAARGWYRGPQLGEPNSSCGYSWAQSRPRGSARRAPATPSQALSPWRPRRAPSTIRSWPRWRCPSRRTLLSPDPRTRAILNLKNPQRAVGADDIWITEMKNIVQVHARKALPWQAQTNVTALLNLFEERRRVANKIEAGRVIQYREEQKALLEHHRCIQMEIITKWRALIKLDTAKMEEITAAAVEVEEAEDQLLAEQKQEELTAMFLDFAAQQIADMNRNEYAHFETDSAKITEKWSLGLVNIEKRVTHVTEELARRNDAFGEMQSAAKKTYHEYDGRVMGQQDVEKARVVQRASLAEKRALMRFEDEMSASKKCASTRPSAGSPRRRRRRAVHGRGQAGASPSRRGGRGRQRHHRGVPRVHPVPAADHGEAAAVVDGERADLLAPEGRRRPGCRDPAPDDSHAREGPQEANK